MKNFPIRWFVVAVFVLSSSLNYLDRQVLAALSPAIMAEFQLTNEDYGRILSVFSLVYALASPAAGLLLDRLSLNVGISVAVGFWSLANMARGLTSGLPGLMVASAALGLGESGGIPATGKAGNTYLEPRERALGAGLSQIGLSIGAVAAPLLANYCLRNFTWREAFLLTGALGFLWIPLWLGVSRLAPKQSAATQSKPEPIGDLLRSRTLWGFVLANLMAMVVYSLWTNWTTIYLTRVFKLPTIEANKLAAWPHFFAYFGALTGGWISYRLMSRGWAALDARRRACLIAAMGILTTAAVPRFSTPTAAALAISFSFFCSSAWSVNLYTMPVDAFGGRAAFGVSLLTMAYGVLQFLISPMIGRSIDRYGFEGVCLVAAVMPLAAYGVLHLTRRREA
ncbi:MAG: MFS transporter [Acidobacteria bacterium]|nr:MFS transporter [Acidobacteriota bacterium]